MLSRKELINNLSEEEKKYIPMFEQISIPDFTKCVAQFAGLAIQEVSNKAMTQYLLTWAEHKYRFFKKMGNKVRIDKETTYIDEGDDIPAKMIDLQNEFPGFAHWIIGFSNVTKNKIRSVYDLDYSIRLKANELFPTLTLEGMSITHFFKKYLKADDDLVTKLGRIFENQEVTANFTLSIDPTDMMLASENPYGWRSCYALETDNSDSYADGCLAAVLDDSSMIVYIWNNSGKYSLYDNFKLDRVRYKRMREWISVAPDFSAIHFNEIYPGKGNYSDELRKTVRCFVEDIINPDILWKRNEELPFDDMATVNREYDYGYSEFCDSRIYVTADGKKKPSWKVYNERIICPCGCGSELPSNYSEEMCYNGDGFIYENYYVEDYWCDEIDDYCPDYCDGEGCRNCPEPNRNRMRCGDDTSERCIHLDPDEAEEAGMFDPFESDTVTCDEKLCDGCPLYRFHHPTEEEKEIKEEELATQEPIEQTKLELNDVIKKVYTGEELLDIL